MANQPSKAAIKTWVKALRSGKFKQTTSSLQDEKGFCCLGVACITSKAKMSRNTDGYLDGGFPVAQEYAPNWLKTIDDKFEELTGLGLADLNDSRGLTFDEIADCLEAVYIHKVLG